MVSYDNTRKEGAFLLAFTHDGATLAVLATTTAESGFIEVPISRLVQPQDEAKPTAESYKHAMDVGPKWKVAIERRITTATENGAVGVESSSSSSSSSSSNSGGVGGVRAAIAERRKEQQAKLAQEAAEAAEAAAAAKAEAKAAAAAKRAAVPKAAKPPAKATGGKKAAPALRTVADVRSVFFSANQCLKSQKMAEVDAAVAITFKGRDLAAASASRPAASDSPWRSGFRWRKRGKREKRGKAR